MSTRMLRSCVRTLRARRLLSAPVRPAIASSSVVDAPPRGLRTVRVGSAGQKREREVVRDRRHGCKQTRRDIPASLGGSPLEISAWLIDEFHEHRLQRNPVSSSSLRCPISSTKH